MDDPLVDGINVAGLQQQSEVTISTSGLVHVGDSAGGILGFSLAAQPVLVHEQRENRLLHIPL